LGRAVRCAVGPQKLSGGRNAGSPPERRMEWRDGIISRSDALYCQIYYYLIDNYYGIV